MKRKTIIEWEFNDCPSPHGWHNPEGLTPEHLTRWANPCKELRLLCRDEIGYRGEGYASICHTQYRFQGGLKEDFTYWTTTPYGELPPVTKYTFPECAPYGWSRTTGKRIEAPEGYELAPEGKTHVGDIVIYCRDGTHAKFVAITKALTAQSVFDAVFVRKAPKWEVGDTVEVANDNEAPRLQAGAKGIVIGENFDGLPRVRQTSPDPHDNGVWCMAATDLRPWQPGYGYMPSGERVPEPPEGWELVPEGEDIGKGSRVYIDGAWGYSLRIFGRAEAGLSVRAYARFKQSALQLREGGYYRRRDDKVRGPIERSCDPYYPWTDGYTSYRDSGLVLSAGTTQHDLIAEVPAPKPQLVPFSGPQDLPEWPVIWVRTKNTPHNINQLAHMDLASVSVLYRGDIRWQELLKDWEISPDRRNWQTAGKEVPSE